MVFYHHIDVWHFFPPLFFDEVFSFSTKKLLDQKVLTPIKAKGLPHQVTDHERHKLAAAATVDTPDNGQ